MKKMNYLLILSVLLAGACSNNKKKMDSQVEVAEAEGISSEADFVVDAEEDLFFDDQFSFEMDESAPQDSVASDSTSVPLIFEEADSHLANTHEPHIDHQAEFAHYTTQQGETLMLVAFNLYGDYRKWKELKDWNAGTDLSNLSPGTVIRYKAPSEKFVWKPAGMPHIVRRGETLGSISDDKYGTVKRWTDIYKNNQPLIRDPNLIFAGFTIYYVPDRDLASEY